jgi:hypothetical protein
MEATLFGITLPSTCWELGVKRFTYSTQFSRHRRVLAARKELSGALEVALPASRGFRLF